MATALQPDISKELVQILQQCIGLYLYHEPIAFWIVGCDQKVKILLTSTFTFPFRTAVKMLEHPSSHIFFSAALACSLNLHSPTPLFPLIIHNENWRCIFLHEKKEIVELSINSVLCHEGNGKRPFVQLLPRRHVWLERRSG